MPVCVVIMVSELDCLHFLLTLDFYCTGLFVLSLLFLSVEPFGTALKIFDFVQLFMSVCVVIMVFEMNFKKMEINKMNRFFQNFSMPF